MSVLASVLISILLLTLGSASQRRLSASTPSKTEKPRVVSTFTAEPEARYPYRENMYRALLLNDGRIIALSIARENRQQTMQGRYSSAEYYWMGNSPALSKTVDEATGLTTFDFGRPQSKQTEDCYFVLSQPTSQKAGGDRCFRKRQKLMTNASFRSIGRCYLLCCFAVSLSSTKHDGPGGVSNNRYRLLVRLAPNDLAGRIVDSIKHSVGKGH